MKIILNITKAVILSVFVLVVSSCSDDDDTIAIPPTLDIVETASADTDLSSLVAALTAADGDLASVLQGTGPFTVLAPTNEAMQAFLDTNGYADISEVPTDALQQVLLNHVIDGEVTSETLSSIGAGYAITSSTAAPDGNNLNLYFNTTDGVVFNGVATVTDADITATNGIIHKVNAVIGLPDVTTFATVDPNLSRLVQGLTAHTFDYVTTLQGDGPFSILAPNNAAFDALLATDDTWTEPGDIPEAALATALNLHVLPNSNVREADLVDGEVTTLEGNITVDATAGTVSDGADPANTATIVNTDIQATNGVIHVIDNVLLSPIVVDPGK